MHKTKAQKAFDDEPFHFTPIFDLVDIICEGSDKDETSEQIEQKHLRYEANAERCASGKLPVLQSTVLRGSFESGWVNPWRCKSNKVHGEKKWRQSCPDKLSSNSGSVLTKAVISNSDYLSPNDTVSWCRTSAEEKENEADASEANGEITHLGKGRSTGNLSSYRNKEPRKTDVQDNWLSCKNNDTLGYRIKRGVKRHRKSHTFKSLNTNECVNWDNEDYSLYKSFRHLVEKRKSRNGEFEAELLEDQSPFIINQNKTFNTRKLFLNSQSSSSSPFSSPVSVPKRKRIKYKSKTYKDKYSDVESDNFDSESSNSIRINRKLSIHTTIRQNSVITPKINQTLPSNLKSMDRDIFVTKFVPSSRALEKFVYKTKKRKRDSRDSCNFPDLTSLPLEDSNYSPTRKKKKFRMTQDNEEDFLLLDSVDIQRTRQKFSPDSEHSPDIMNQITNSNTFPEPQLSKNSSDNNHQYLSGYHQFISDLPEDLISWRQDYGNESTPVTSQGENIPSQLFLQNNEELHTTPNSKSKVVVSNNKYLTPDEKVCGSCFTQRFTQKPRIYQDNLSKSNPKGYIPELENRSRDLLASSVISSPPQKINSKSNIFSTSDSSFLSQQLMNQEFSLDLTVAKSKKGIETPSLSSLSIPIIFDQRELSPVIQFSSRKMPESSTVTSADRDRASQLTRNQRNSSLQILNLSPCESRSLKYSNSILPGMRNSKDCNERCNVSLLQSSEKEFYALEDVKQKENVVQDECKKPTEAPSTKQKEIIFSPLTNHESAKTIETSLSSSSEVDTPFLGTKNPFKANSQFLESNHSNKSNRVMIGTPNSSEDKSQNSGRQSPWAPEIQTKSFNVDDPGDLPDLAPSSFGYDVVNIYASPDSSTEKDNIDSKLPKIKFNTTPENKVTLSLNTNAIEPSHLNSQSSNIQKSFESALKNPWKSSIKKPSSFRPKKRVSFQQSTKPKEDFSSGNYSASPPNNFPARISSQQPEQMINLPLSIEMPKKSFSENIPDLTTFSKSHSYSKANCSPRLSAMAEAFIAADEQTYSEEKEDESSLLKDQVALSSKCNDNETGQVVTTMTTITKEPINSDEMNNHDFNIGISISTNSINDNEQKELQSNCWLDSPSITSLKDIDFSVLAAENNTFCDPLLSGVEDFLEDWSVDNVLK
ncbi:hypothetical protein EPUL_006765 [Erysiphe pulchra]|uniref:Protamine P1 n=1 Tax=Erysiphe pulchra TaxID=225359 RepID=A0A2S4PMU4_9PEZI|nr:hypothetical protein EPUL_006765 [Erysiphe pulchra]